MPPIRAVFPASLSTSCVFGTLPSIFQSRDHGIPDPGGFWCNLAISGKLSRSEGRVHICSGPSLVEDWHPRCLLPVPIPTSSILPPYLRFTSPTPKLAPCLQAPENRCRGRLSIDPRARPPRRSLRIQRQVSVAAETATLDSNRRHIFSFGTLQQNLVSFIQIATWPFGNAARLTGGSRVSTPSASHRRRRNRPGTRTRARSGLVCAPISRNSRSVGTGTSKATGGSDLGAQTRVLAEGLRCAAAAPISSPAQLQERHSRTSRHRLPPPVD